MDFHISNCLHNQQVASWKLRKICPIMCSVSFFGSVHLLVPCSWLFCVFFFLFLFSFSLYYYTPPPRILSFHCLFVSNLCHPFLFSFQQFIVVWRSTEQLVGRTTTMSRS